jgi:hypothetical protein
MLDIVVKRHPQAGDILTAVFERSDMLDDIVKRRGYVTDAEHRFFMALLLNVDGRERILSLIEHRFPDFDPIEKILDWTFDLSQTRIYGIDNSNALGIPEFGDAEMFAMEDLLKGKMDDEVKAAYIAANPDGDPVVTGAIQKLRESIIFRPLI